MTNSGVVPRQYLSGVMLVMLLFAHGAAAAQDQSGPTIVSPFDGQVVQGQVVVKGTTQVDAFASAELSFAYASDPTNTWFLIQSASIPVTNGTVGTWDTSAITDADYALRLRVILADGSTRDATVTVRLRNYTVVPTASPVLTPTLQPAVSLPTAIVIVPTAAASATSTPEPVISTATPLSANPMTVTPGRVSSAFWWAALLVGVLAVGFGLIIRWRR